MKENIFVKIKKIILNCFKKDKPLLIENNSIETDKKDLEKDRIMRIYEEVKKNQEILNELEEEDLYKVMILLNEEISIVNNNVNEKAEEIEQKIDMYLNKKN